MTASVGATLEKKNTYKNINNKKNLTIYFIYSDLQIFLLRIHEAELQVLRKSVMSREP